MGNRIIKESVCTSESIDSLSWFEECLFYRLIVNADDFGIFDGRTQIIKAKLFPLKSVTDKQIIDALNKLSSVGIVIPKKHGLKPYLQIATWAKHQQIRNKKSKYVPTDENGNPTFDNQLQSIDINCNQLSSQSNPIQSNPNPIRIQYNPVHDKDFEKSFETFWGAYPKKVSKKEAEKAWKKIRGQNVETILSALNAQKATTAWTRDGGKYIPNAATWLNGERWNDEIGGGGHGNSNDNRNTTQPLADARGTSYGKTL